MEGIALWFSSRRERGAFLAFEFGKSEKSSIDRGQAPFIEFCLSIAPISNRPSIVSWIADKASLL